MISGFGPGSYWLSNEPGSTKNYNITLMNPGQLFGSFGPGVPPTLPRGPTNNKFYSTEPHVDGYCFAFYYGPTVDPEDSYQVFSQPSTAPTGFSHYGCWGEGECVNAKVTYVPAPLPLLGVGAAFGYSRKLRKRIKARKTPEELSAIV